MKKIFASIIILFSMTIPCLSFGQDCPECGPGDTPEDVPLDNNLVVLLVAGVAFGCKKAYDHKLKTTAVYIGN